MIPVEALYNRLALMGREGFPVVADADLILPRGACPFGDESRAFVIVPQGPSLAYLVEDYVGGEYPVDFDGVDFDAVTSQRSNLHQSYAVWVSCWSKPFFGCNPRILQPTLSEALIYLFLSMVAGKRDTLLDENKAVLCGGSYDESGRLALVYEMDGKLTCDMIHPKKLWDRLSSLGLTLTPFYVAN